MDERTDRQTDDNDLSSILQLSYVTLLYSTTTTSYLLADCVFSIEEVKLFSSLSIELIRIRDR